MATNKGQTVIEYVVLIGIITIALFYMGPLLKRGVQSLVKATADQIGNQQRADQDFTNTAGSGFLVGSNTQTVSPALARKYAVVMPMMPAPITTVS